MAFKRPSVDHAPWLLPWAIYREFGIGRKVIVRIAYLRPMNAVQLIYGAAFSGCASVRLSSLVRSLPPRSPTVSRSGCRSNKEQMVRTETTD